MAKSKKPALVTQYLENISSEGFEKHADVIRKFVRGKNGVYALYRKGKRYYSALASDLRGRLRWHLRDRHAQRWDTFSVYLTIGDQHLRELESLILRVAQPPGNRQSENFPGRRILTEASLAKLRESSGSNATVFSVENHCRMKTNKVWNAVAEFAANTKTHS